MYVNACPNKVVVLYMSLPLQSTHQDIRLGFLPNPVEDSSNECSRYLEALLLSQRPKVVHDLVKPLLEKGCGSKEAVMGVVSSSEVSQNNYCAICS